MVLQILIIGWFTKLTIFFICRSWQAESVDSGCGNCMQTSPHPESYCGESLHSHIFAPQADQYTSGKSHPTPLKASRKRYLCSVPVFANPWLEQVWDIFPSYTCPCLLSPCPYHSYYVCLALVCSSASLQIVHSSFHRPELLGELLRSHHWPW